MSFKSIGTTVDTASAGIIRFAKLERVLAFLCLLLPLFVIVFDGGPVRSSISAYYNMNNNQVYGFLMTMAAMLFIVNGVVKDKHRYNTLLGLALAGVVLFPCKDFQTIHNLFAIGFFAGNAVVMVVYTSRKERWFKILMVLGMVIAVVAYFLFESFTLFYAEWISFAIIALHYILESWGKVD